MSQRTVYLDNNATTPLDPRVLSALLPFQKKYFANPSGIYRLSRDIRGAVEKARRQVAALLAADPSEIVFTSGGTESDNLAIKGAAFSLKEKGNHIITTQIEHPAVLDTCKYLEIAGFDLTYLPVNADGIVDPGLCQKAINGRTILVTIMHANNETGVLQAIGELSRITREKNILFHTDAVQSVGKAETDVKKTPVDLLSLSGHKLYGPKGVGALYVRSGTKLLPLFHGGGQERYRRSGTENTAGIIGLGKACDLALREKDSREKKVGRLRDELQESLLKSLPDIRINASSAVRTYNTLNISIPGVKSRDLLLALDREGICASAGSACHAGLPEPSHVLKAMGAGEDLIFGTLRLSLGIFNTREDIQRVIRLLPDTVMKLRKRKIPGAGNNEI